MVRREYFRYGLGARRYAPSRRNIGQYNFRRRGNNRGMRSNLNLGDTASAIDRLNKLKGYPLIVKVNRGRNKIERLEGEIEATYPNVFTIRLADGGLSSFSYADVLSKNVLFLRSTPGKNR